MVKLSNNLLPKKYTLSLSDNIVFCLFDSINDTCSPKAMAFAACTPFPFAHPLCVLNTLLTT